MTTTVTMTTTNEHATAPESAEGVRAAAFDECISVAARWRDGYAERIPGLDRHVEARDEAAYNVLTNLVKMLRRLKNASAT